MMKKIIIILSIIMVVLIGIGFLMTANETNTSNFKNITLVDGTTIKIPADFTVKNPFSNYTENDGFYYTNCDLESKNYGWIHIEYTHDPIETMAHGQNSTEAENNNGVYEYDVFDANGHQVMRITGSNPAIVKTIGETVKFNTSQSTNTAVKTTVEKVSTDNNKEAQKDSQAVQDIKNNPNMPDDMKQIYAARQRAAEDGVPMYEYTKSPELVQKYQNRG